MEFGDRLGILMEQKGYTLAKVEELTGTARSSISSIVNNNRKPPFEFLIKLVTEVFPDADLNWLFRGAIYTHVIANEEGESYGIPETPEVLIEIIEEKAKKLKAVLAQK